MKTFKTDSIVTKLASWYVVSVFVTALGGFLYLHYSLSRMLDAQNTGILDDRLRSIVQVINYRLPGINKGLVHRVEGEWVTERFETVLVEIRALDQTVITRTPGFLPALHDQIFSGLKREPIDIKSGAHAKPRFRRDAGGHPYLALSVSVPANAPSEAAVVDITVDLGNAEALLRNQWERLILTLVVLLFGTVFLGRHLSRWAVKPVEKIIEAATRISSANLHERVTVEDLPEELRKLASTVNGMLGRLEESFTRLSRFSSDLAHELRTPLNNLRGVLEVTLSRERPPQEYREALYSALEEVERLTRIIEALLFLAVVEHPDRQLHRERIRLREEALNLVDFHSVAAAEQGTSLEVDVPEDLELDVERTLFQRALSNLLSNAIRHTPDGKIVVRGRRENGRTVVEVQDTGSGISADDLPRVFDRFYRGDPSRKTGRHEGFGLGLTIVKTVVGLHQGSVEIQSGEGRGTTIKMSFA